MHGFANIMVVLFQNRDIGIFVKFIYESEV